MNENINKLNKLKSCHNDEEINIKKSIVRNHKLHEKKKLLLKCLEFKLLVYSRIKISFVVFSTHLIRCEVRSVNKNDAPVLYRSGF